MDSVYIAFALLAVVVPFVVRGGVAAKIRSPKLGLLNLKGAAATDMLAQDRHALSTMFSVTEESVGAPPRCDVLFIYCDIDESGRLAGTDAGLRDLIRDAGARVVVVASENAAARGMASAKAASHGRANLVLTLDRKGAVFTEFFSRLFAQMMTGVSMPRAWVKLAPQIPGHVHADCPDAIFLAEAGQLAFK